MRKSEESFTENRRKGEKLDVMCVECKRPTKHRVVASLDKDGTQYDNDEGWSVDWNDGYQIIQCLGCESISFRHAHWFSEDEDIESDGITERLYPKRDAQTITAQGFHNTPTILRRIYGEVIECFNNDCLILLC